MTRLAPLFKQGQVGDDKRSGYGSVVATKPKPKRSLTYFRNYNVFGNAGEGWNKRYIVDRHIEKLLVLLNKKFSKARKHEVLLVWKYFTARTKEL